LIGVTGGVVHRVLDIVGAAAHLKGMKASEADILFIPGYGNSDAEHWQSRWQAKLSTSRRVEQASWRDPVREDWVGTIADAINGAAKPVVLVAHSLGIAPVLHALPACGNKVAGAFFVAPPDLLQPGELPEGLDLDRLRGFGPYPRDPLPFPSITVASRKSPMAATSMPATSPMPGARFWSMPAIPAISMRSPATVPGRKARWCSRSSCRA
jgi:predicted alpha/beta hydrolase family esterase